MFETSVDRFSGAVRGSGAVEVGQDVDRPAFEGAPERGQLGQGGRDAGAEEGDDGIHELASACPVGLTVCSDHALVDAPGRLDLHVLVGGEEVRDPLFLFVGEQVGPGLQGPP